MGASRLHHPREFARASRNVHAYDGIIRHPSYMPPTASEKQAVAEMLSAGPTQSMITADASSVQLAAAMAERFIAASIATYGRA